MTLACTVIRQQFVSNSTQNSEQFHFFSSIFIQLGLDYNWIWADYLNNEATISYNRVMKSGIYDDCSYLTDRLFKRIWTSNFNSWGDLVCKKCNLKNVGGRVSKNEVRSQEPFHCVNHFYILNPTMFQRLSDFINNIYMENHNLPGSNIEEARSHISTQILWINLDCSISIVRFWLIINWFRYLRPWGSAGAVFVYQVIKW